MIKNRTMKHTTEHTSHIIKTFSISLLLACAVALAVAPASAYATTSAEKQAEAQAAYATLTSLQADLDRASCVYFDALTEESMHRAMKDQAQVELDNTNAKLAENQGKLANTLRSMYRNGSTSLLDVFLDSASFQDLATNISMIQQVNRNYADLIQENKSLRSEIEVKKAEYTEQERLANEKAEAARKTKEESEQLVASMQATYENLSAEAYVLLQQEYAYQASLQAANVGAVLDANRQSAGTYLGSDNSGYSYFASSDGSTYSVPTYDPNTGNSVLDRAYAYLGNASYVWGGCAPGQFDCSGFVSYCLSGEYSRLGTTNTFLGYSQVSEPQPGDICVNEGHCGIYIGNGQMIHCADYGTGVVEGPVQGGMTFHRY